jgi:tRNA pseudouridine55 synthase
MDGFLVIDKPAGVTSHDVVNKVRAIVGQKKVGHTGTLDPFAVGVLPMALGEATKAIPFLDEAVKEYRAVMRLGEATDTQDRTGMVSRKADWSHITPEILLEATSRFTGRISQIPPMFSALKRDGVPLYKLARRGLEVERDDREIEIFSLSVEKISLQDVAFTVRCSRGTYVRTLAHDIGERLGCGAHLLELRRTASGPFLCRDMLSIDALAGAARLGKLCGLLVSPYAALSHLKDLRLTDLGASRIANGIAPSIVDIQNALSYIPLAGERFRLSREGKLLAVAEQVSGQWRDSGKDLRILRVFKGI